MVVDLEIVIRELAPGLLRYCAARMRDSGLAEEIAQETLAALVQRWRRHGAPDSPEDSDCIVREGISHTLLTRCNLTADFIQLLGSYLRCRFAL